MTLFSLALVALAVLHETDAFATIHPRPAAKAGQRSVFRTVSVMSTEMETSRQELLQRTALFVSTVGAAAIPKPVSAAVGEGDLPDGARQFLNVLNAQRDWVALGKTVAERKGELSESEWKNVQLFLRKFYQACDDMAFMAKGLAAPLKKEALSLIDAMKKEVKAADKPAAARDDDGFLAAQSSVASKLDIFLQLFNDVPDEL
ncbi:unnamed protein product [Phaeothamnion confervicola]